MFKFIFTLFVLYHSSISMWWGIPLLLGMMYLDLMIETPMPNVTPSIRGGAGGSCNTTGGSSE